MSRQQSVRLIVVLFLISGFCNLVYQMVWTRMFNLVFGVTVFAVSAVVAAFMLGLAAGALLWARRREGDSVLLMHFGAIHAGIGLSAMMLLFLFGPLQNLVTGLHHVFNPGFLQFRVMLFCMALLMLLVPTTLMGATFPAAVRIVIRDRATIGAHAGLLYGINTLGSVAGICATVFLFLGFLGMRGTVMVAVVLDLLIAVVALGLDAMTQGERSVP